MYYYLVDNKGKIHGEGTSKKALEIKADLLFTEEEQADMELEIIEE